MPTDLKLRALKPRPKVYRVTDGTGLCIEVRPTGAKHWRWRYRFAGKANMLDLGAYPSLGLQDARRERDRQKEILEAGQDPAGRRRLERLKAALGADESFEAVARE